jgi:hypothetical protein
MTVVLSYLLLLFLPEDVLTLHPSLKIFTNFMSMLIPSIGVFASNLPQESLLLVISLLWALLPCWIKLYYQTLKPLYTLAHKKIQVNVNRGEETIWHAFFRIVALVLAAWIFWSGYPFVSGEPETTRGMIFSSQMRTVFFTYIFSNGFLILLISSPAFLRLGFIVFKFSFLEK